MLIMQCIHLILFFDDGKPFVCQGFLRLDGRRNRRYVVVKRGKLCLYNTVSVRMLHCSTAPDSSK